MSDCINSVIINFPGEERSYNLTYWIDEDPYYIFRTVKKFSK